MFREKQKVSVFVGLPFSGAIPSGRINISSKGDTATIRLTNQQNSEAELTVVLGKHSEFKKQAFYHEGRELEQTETLVNTWITKKGYGWIMKYSAKDQLTFVLYSQGDLQDDLDCLIKEYPRFFPVAYIQERQFFDLAINQCKLDKATLSHINNDRLQFLCEHVNQVKALVDDGMAIVQLAAIDLERLTVFLDAARMNLKKAFVLLSADELLELTVDHLRLFFKETDAIDKMIDQGLTFEEFKRADIKTLSRCSQLSHKIEASLKFLTPQQILKINHEPLKLTVNQTPKNKAILYDSWGEGSGENDDMSFKYNQNQFVATYKNKKTNEKVFFKMLFNKLTDNEVEEMGSTFVDCDVLVFDWYLVSVDDPTNMTLFSPELKMMIEIVNPDNFQMIEPMLLHFWNVKPLPYLQEFAFAQMLKENKSSIEALRALPGMTQEKLILLMTHQHDVKDLLLYGLTLADFASVDEARLEHVLTHFQEARWALKFVNAAELLAINKPVAAYAPNMFYHVDEQQANTVHEDNAKPTCAIS